MRKMEKTKLFLDTFKVMEGEAIALKNGDTVGDYLFGCMDFMEKDLKRSERFIIAEEHISELLKKELEEAGENDIPENLVDIVRFSIFTYISDRYLDDSNFDVTVFDDLDFIEEQEDIRMFILAANQGDIICGMEVIALYKSKPYGGSQYYILKKR